MAETASQYGSSGSFEESHRTSDEGGSMMDQAKQKAQEVRSEAEDMMRGRAQQGSEKAGEQALHTAHDLRSVSDTLRDRGREGAAHFIEEGAGQVERFASYLRTSDPDTIYRDVQDYARRQPWLVAAGGAALGFLAARFLKAAGQDSPAGGSQSGREFDPVHYEPGRYGEESSRGTGYSGRHLSSVAPVFDFEADEGSSPDEEFGPSYGTEETGESGSGSSGSPTSGSIRGEAGGEAATPGDATRGEASTGSHRTGG
jgi:hypothetical protein